MALRSKKDCQTAVPFLYISHIENLLKFKTLSVSSFDINLPSKLII